VAKQVSLSSYFEQQTQPRNSTTKGYSYHSRRESHRESYRHRSIESNYLRKEKTGILELLVIKRRKQEESPSSGM